MRRMTKWVVAGSSMLGAGAMMTVGAGAVSGQNPVTVSQVASAHTSGDASAADQAAVSYVDSTYPGSGVAAVLTTTAATEAGVSVYDVSIVAPDGSTYVVHVQQSNDAVLSSNLAVNLVTTPTVNSTAPTDSSSTDATDTSSTDATETSSTDATEASSTESVETETNVSTGEDNQNSGTSSSDTQGGSTSSDEASAGLDATTTLGQTTGAKGTDGTQSSAASGDGSSDGLGISTQVLSGSSDSGSGSTTNGDN